MLYSPFTFISDYSNDKNLEGFNMHYKLVKLIHTTLLATQLALGMERSEY